MVDNPWVELERATNIAEAEVIRSFLQSRSIEVLIPDEHSARTMHHLTPMLGFVRLQVRKENLAAAQDALKKMRITIAEEHNAEPYANTEEGDSWAIRASRTAIFGLFMVPLILNFYSMTVIFQCWRKRLPMSGKGRRHLFVAALFNAVAIVGWGSFLAKGGLFEMLKRYLGVHY